MLSASENAGSDTRLTASRHGSCVDGVTTRARPNRRLSCLDVSTRVADQDSRSSRLQEVEVKYRIFDPDAVADVLAAHHVVLSAPTLQDDQAYAPVGWTYEQSKIGVPFARLRTENGRHMFTVKKPIDNELSCVEHECQIADRQQMHAALLVMGFQPTVRIVKTRRSGALGKLTLCLDEVEHVGVFLEVEQLIAAGQLGEAAQQQLDQFVRSLGLPVQRTTETYDSLIRAATLATGLEQGASTVQPCGVDVETGNRWHSQGEADSRVV